MAKGKLFTIVKATHFFKLEKVSPLALDVIKRFAFGNTEFTFEKCPESGRFIRLPRRIYAGRKLDNTEFRFNIGQLDAFLNYLKEKRVERFQYEVREKPIYQPTKASMAMPSWWEPRPKQVPILEYLAKPGRMKVVTLQTGGGKYQPLDSKIKVPGGWSTMGEMCVGKQVTTPNGGIATVTNIFPQGEKQIYRVTLEDGRSTEAGGEHLWKVIFPDLSSKVIDTLQIKEYVDKGLYTYLPTVMAELDQMDYYQKVFHSVTGGHIALDSGNENLPWPEGEDYEEFEYVVRASGGLCQRNKDGSVSYRLDRHKLQILDIEETGVAEAQCIEIDDPDHLYITDDFIVTHNTATSLKAIADRGERLAITVLGRYFDKWQGDIIENYGEDYAQDKVIAIRGYKALQEFMQELFTEGELLYDIILLTTTTWNDYIKAYESLGTMSPPEWWIAPEDFWARLGIGIKLVDEVHQHFHANFMGDLYTHGPMSIGLSATLECVEQFERKMFELAYPPSVRMDGGAYVKYCNVSALHYRINNIQKIRHKQRGAYSHNLFERSLKKRKSQYENYFEMIARIIKREYLEVRKNEEQKMIIFVANVFMCEELRDYLKEVLNDPLLRINKYTSEDALETITEDSNICITTLGSAGTAIDIKNLIFCLMTTAVSQPRANLQALGRLRDEYKTTEVEPHFMYLVCDDIAKQVAYHKEKLKLFDGRVLCHKEVFYPDAI